MLKLEQSEKLIRLQIAILESFDETQIRQTCKVLSGVDYDALPGKRRRDKVRELLLWSNRHGLIPKLVSACNQMSSDFNWRGRLIVFDLPDAVKENAEHLTTILIHHFNLDDLRQLAFCLGVDFEEIEGPHGVFGTTDNLSEKNKQWLSGLGINCDLLSPEEIDVALNEMWIESFIGFCRVEDAWAQAMAICYHLHPEAFSAKS